MITSDQISKIRSILAGTHESCFVKRPAAGVYSTYRDQHFHWSVNGDEIDVEELLVEIEFLQARSTK
jgi:hypothetical protein